MGKYFSKIQIWKIGREAKEYKEKIKGLNAEEFRPELVEKTDDKLTRLWMAQTARNMFLKNPVIGIGLGNYKFLYNQYKPEGTPKKENEKPHNAYLEILAESGIIGFALFGGAFLILFNGIYKKYRSISTTDNKILFSGLMLALIGLMIHGLSFGILVHNHTWIIIGLVLAAITVL
jgi:O-antigen ligase